MFKNFIKLLLLFLFSFTHFLYADEAITHIHITNATAHESDGTMTFTISLDKTPFLPVTIKYRTLEGTAKAGSDYVEKNDTVTFGGLFISSRDITIDLVNDTKYEDTQEFYIDVWTDATGYVSNYDATGTILDDDVKAFELDRFYSKSVKETDSDQTTNVVAYFNQITPSALTLKYHTEDGTAHAGSDYITKSNETINVPAGVDKVNLPVTIKGDYTPEESKNFKIIIDSISMGTATDKEATVTINDDDTIEVDISSVNSLEGNISDNNKLEFKIFLSKKYPLNTPLTIKYKTVDGSDPSATLGVDYRENEGSVTFNKDDVEKIIYVDIIGDNDIEDDEKVKMVISNSSYIIDHDSTAKILNDDGKFPGITFNSKEFSIIEGNSSQKMLDFNFTLAKPALAGASFTYDTWDDSAEDEAKDNDYIWTHGEYNLTVGEQNISISVPVNGDTKIENDESFHFGISKLNKLSLNGSDEAIGTIINDDGSYPAIKFNNSHLSVVEGNSSTTNLKFLLSFDTPALKGSSFDFTIEDIDTNASDYVALTKNTYSFAGGETNATIVVQVKGDIEVEGDEQFKLKISNENNFSIDGDRFSIGEIINDDFKEYPFKCNEESFISFNTETYATSGNSLFNTITLSNGKLLNSTTITKINGVNSIGYNIKDNYIWGYNLNLNKVVRIDSHHQAKTYDIIGLSNKFYVAADVDKNGILYLFSRENSLERKTLVRVDLKNLTTLPSITLTQEINTADMAFNPIDNNLYFIQKGTSTLYKISILSTKGTVNPVGDTAIGTVDPIINFFDRDGNFYFNKDTTSMYKIDTSSSSKATWFSNLDSHLRNGDGARCANAPVTPPIKDNTPLVCDSSMYLSSSIKRGDSTKGTGKMWLHKIDTQKNPFAFNVIDDEGDTKLYNALAYSDSGDANTTNFLFALYNDELMKIGLNGKAISLGKISTLSPLLSKRQLFAGAIYDGYYYISGPGVDYNKIFKVKISDKSVTEINLSAAISLLDFSFTPNGKYLHGIIDGGKLVKIDVSSGDVTFIGSAHTGYQFDSSFSDKTGRFFANDSKGNGFFEFDLTTGDKLFLSASQKATFNDGANCLKAALLFTDFGDAPLSYGTPRHNIANGVFMGHNVDHDIKSFHSINADGDDINGTDDEDGVTLLDGTDINGTTFEVDKVQDLNISVSKSAYLNAWLDFNLNGVFDSSEKIINAKHLTAGNHTISFNIPKSAKQGKKTYIRFRYSSTQNLNATQGATDGEVEDYTVVLGTKFKGIPGTFNVERVDSYKQTINSNERNAWYTQIVGKDFDYHVVFYDVNITKEQELINVPVKIELIDSNKTEGQNLIAPPHYDYFSSSSTHKSRILVTKPIYDKDLKDTIATKEAIFRVKYPAFDDGSVKPFICKKGITAEECYKQATTPKADDPVYVKYAYAQDKFAIRPEKIYVSIKDKNQTILNSKVNNTITLASGYKDYNLTVTATKYSDDTPAKGYTKLADSSIDMNITGLTCQDTSPIVEPIDFKDGLFQDLSFSHDNVGKYLLKIEDDKEWTAIDQNSSILGCIKNSSERVTDTKGKVGCDIVVNRFDTKLIFQPDHFKVKLNMNNLPKSGHTDFIYMMELNAINDNVAIQFDGNITAQTEDNKTTKNFTAGCVATNILLDLNATTVSVDGIDKNITTANNLAAVNFSRVIRFNNENNRSKFDVNNTLRQIGKLLPITSNRFLNENNGSMSLDMRYNLNKNLKQAINPVEVTFNSIEVTAPDANSSAYEKSSHIPDGNSTFTDNVKNFYFARVVSELDNYPRVNINISPLVRTPLNVDIYCYTPIDPNYCSNRNVIANSNVSGTVREQNGWYISAKHNGNLDGNVTELVSSNNILTITPNPTPVGADDITLNQGANGRVNEVFNNCSQPSSTISITTNPVLTFIPSEYTVNCTDSNASQWTGIGRTGNVIEVQPKVNKTGKMDW